MLLELPSVTLLCVETQMHEMARRAISDTVAKVKFAEVVIHTNKPDLIPIGGARYVDLQHLPDKIQHGTYCYNDSPKSVTTPHMIFLEWDGAVRDVRAWEPSFLDYDYIGAPWPGKRAGQWTPREGCSVGNGGFTLWSKKLMDCLSANRATLRVATDTHISIEHRRALENLCGAKWASEPVGFQFSYEHGTNEERSRPSFGVHDVFNWPLALSQGEITERAKLLMEDPYIIKTSKLFSMAERAPYLKAIPNYENRMMVHRPPQKREIPRGASRSLPPPDPRSAFSRDAYMREMQRRGLKA